ncbi:hypothetical protein HD806DRAFT_538750 [Xylariaceae sp. AK1471]|nr:hypothetical protein HD806DRAFT_538750 [Xylariaceae sp. AK1471]
MATNVWLLIRGVDTMPSEGACGGYGYIFIFSQQAIDRTTRIILAVFGILFALPFVGILFGLSWVVLVFILTCTISLAIDILDPDQELIAAFINTYDSVTAVFLNSLITTQFGTLLSGLIATFREVPTGSIGAGNLLRTYASISIASACIEQKRAYSKRQNNKKGIRGVNELDTTGQLIPFVVDVVSFAKAVHEAFLSWIKHKYDDWDKADIELILRDGGRLVAARLAAREA